jgi:hypothetical protein
MKREGCYVRLPAKAPGTNLRPKMAGRGRGRGGTPSGGAVPADILSLVLGRSAGRGASLAALPSEATVIQGAQQPAIAGAGSGVVPGTAKLAPLPPSPLDGE